MRSSYNSEQLLCSCGFREQLNHIMAPSDVEPAAWRTALGAMPVMRMLRLRAVGERFYTGRSVVYRCRRVIITNIDREEHLLWLNGYPDWVTPFDVWTLSEARELGRYRMERIKERGIVEGSEVAFLEERGMVQVPVKVSEISEYGRFSLFWNHYQADFFDPNVVVPLEGEEPKPRKDDLVVLRTGNPETWVCQVVKLLDSEVFVLPLLRELCSGMQNNLIVDCSELHVISRSHADVIAHHLKERTVWPE